jgi:hypothetical protein
MNRPLPCETHHFGQTKYAVYFEDYDYDFSKILNEKLLKRRDVIYVQVKFGDLIVEGFIARSNWKNIKRRNLTYVVDDKVYSIKDVISKEIFLTSHITNLISENKLNYKQILVLDKYVDSK